MRKRSTLKFITAAALSILLLIGSSSPLIAGTVGQAKLSGNGKTVKNVILLISDGWGYNQILATDFYTNGKSGTQVYEKFPTKVAMSTYSLEGEGTADDNFGYYNPSTIWENFEQMKLFSTDSASAGTAMSTGEKTYDAAIGVDQDKQELDHIARDFENLGRATGVISSVQLSHATPASFVAHNVSRNNYSELANEMILESATDVIMGAGHPNYDDSGSLRSAPDYRYVGGDSTWQGLVLGTLETSDADADGINDPWTLIQSKEAFETMQFGETPERVIGVPMVATTLQQARRGVGTGDAYAVPFNTNVPSLAVMTRAALNVLDNDPDGFFLMIEGGAIDWAGHANQSGRLIEEQIAFNHAVDAVCAWVNEYSNWSETLVIVTGDHETGYLTGTPGVYDDVDNNGKGNMPKMAWNSGDHTNQLIPLFARGVGAEIFKKLADMTDPIRGKYMDNTEISKAIRSLIG